MTDWTARDGRTNSSATYVAIVDEVDRLIRDSAFSLIRGQTHDVARLIVSQLAYGPYNMTPTRRAE